LRSARLTSRPTRNLGALTARLLAGAWREDALAVSLSPEDLAEITPLLLKSGCGALAWTRIGGTDLAASAAGVELRGAFHLHMLQAILREHALTEAATALEAAGVEPLLGKGWAIACLYPDPGLRPYGDIDLYATPEECDAVASAVAQLQESAGGSSAMQAAACAVDLHRGFAELDDRSQDELYRRSRRASINAANIRLFSYEDNLRLACLHTLRHGAWRPLWLCDIAAALEARPPDFDWAYFLSGDSRRSTWTACAIGLAHQLLGAMVDGTPVERQAKQVPGWAIRTVIRQWGTPFVAHGLRQPLGAHRRNPGTVLRGLVQRWPNAIEATIGMKAPFNYWPRPPIQVGECVRRLVGFARQAASK